MDTIAVGALENGHVEPRAMITDVVDLWTVRRQHSKIS
jgi:hypothetical protein